MTVSRTVSFTLSNDDFRDICVSAEGDLFEECKLKMQKKFLVYEIKYKGESFKVHRNRLESVILALATRSEDSNCASIEEFCMHFVFDRPNLNIFQMGNVRNLLQYAAFGQIEKYCY